MAHDFLIFHNSSLFEKLFFIEKIKNLIKKYDQMAQKWGALLFQFWNFSGVNNFFE
jgi:hypothetical protein